MVLYVGHGQLPSSVRHALRCCFTTPNTPELIVARQSTLEVYAILPTQLSLRQSVTLFGLIQHIQAYVKPPNQTATVLVLTSDLKLFTLRYCHAAQAIRTTASLSLDQPSARPADYLQTSIVDPHARCVLVHALNGILHLIPLTFDCKSDSELLQIRQLRLNEVNVHGLAFASLPADQPPTLLIIYSNHLANRVLRARPIDLNLCNCDKEIGQSFPCSDPASSLIIPIHDQSGAMLIVGEESVQLIQLGNLSSSKSKGKAKAGPAQVFGQQLLVGPKSNLPLGSYVCYCQIDDEPNLWILGDTYGHLHLLHLSRSSPAGCPSLTHEPAGSHLPSPESLVYLSNRHIYLASHYGDSQLLRLTGTSTPELITTYSNLAPIADAVLVPGGNEYGLVTCSGAYEDGSLRLVSHGLKLVDTVGLLPVRGVERVWCLGNSIIMGFRLWNRFISLSDQGPEEKDDLFGFASDGRTLAIGMCDGIPVQVLEDKVLATGCEPWTPPSQESLISLGDIGGKFTLLGIDRQVTLLKLDSKLRRFSHTGSASFDHQVSALSVDSTAALLAVSQWTTNTITLLSLPSLTPLTTLSSDSPYGLHSLLFAPLRRTTYLLAGMNDGTVLALRLDGVREVWRRVMSVGLSPVKMSFVIVGRDGELERAVWVHSNRASLILERTIAQLSVSPLSNGQLTTSTTLGSSGLLAVIEPGKGVRLGRIEDLGTRLHVAKISLGGEQPRRIAHSVSLRAFAVVCVRQILDQESGQVERFGSVKILDDQTFELLYDFQLLSVEQGTSIGAIDLGSNLVPHFVVGTGLVQPNEREPSSGRILAFSATTCPSGKRIFQLKRMGKVTGAVQGLGSLPGGKLVSSANAFIHAFSPNDDNDDVDADLGEGGGGEGGFKLLDTWGGGFVSQTILTDQNWVVVGDLYKSVVVLKFDTDKNELSVLGRDYSVMGVRQVGRVSNRELVGGDGEFNLFCVEMVEPEDEEEKRQPKVDEDECAEEEEEEEEAEGEWEEEERMMRVEKVFCDDRVKEIGVFGLGENVNKLVSGSLAVGEHLVKHEKRWSSKLVFVSSTGGIGVIVKILDDEVGKKLVDLESRVHQALAKNKKTIGGLDPFKFRKFKSKWRETDHLGFVDGDLLQLFNNADDILSEEEDSQIIEELGRLH